MARTVLILGGGFGGLYAARKLERALPPHAATVQSTTSGHPPLLAAPAADARETAAEATVPR